MESPPVTPRRRAPRAALVLLCLPLAVALVEIVTFQVRNRNNRSLISGGEQRQYLLYVPASYDPGRPTPLVISMHGAGGWPVQQRDISGWNAVADEHGFIVAYPSGRGRRASRAWRLSGAQDARFISDLIDELEREYPIDPARIYANGLSAGGGMSFLLSCRLWERIAAIGSVAAANIVSWDECEESRPLPVMAFHGTADSATPYAGGESWVGDIAFPDVERWMARWAERNACGPVPIDTAVAGDVRRREYHGCADAADVVLFTIHAGGHTWPGGEPLPEWFLGPTSRSIDATREMWAFFERHAKAPAPAGAGPPS
jgi:polyhydroxybutyrate depolymerase